MEKPSLRNDDDCADAGSDHLAWRLAKPASQQQQLQHVQLEPEQPREPEDDTDSDDHDSSSKVHRLSTPSDVVTVLPSPQQLPPHANAHVHRPHQTYPWLELNAATRHADGKHDASVEHLQPPHETRSAPARHNVHAVTASTREMHNVHSLLLPSGSPTHPGAGSAQAATRPVAHNAIWHSVPGPMYGATSASTSVGSSTRRHSILRLGSSRRPLSDRGGGMKKSASVEFKLHEEGSRLKHSSSDTRAFNSVGLGRDAPRRLTDEEKEELYRIRPDLEIGPSPFFQEQMAELQRRNQQRVLFAMFGGMVSIILLLVFYALLAQG